MEVIDSFWDIAYRPCSVFKFINLSKDKLVELQEQYPAMNMLSLPFCATYLYTQDYVSDYSITVYPAEYIGLLKDIEPPRKSVICMDLHEGIIERDSLVYMENVHLNNEHMNIDSMCNELKFINKSVKLVDRVKDIQVTGAEDIVPVNCTKAVYDGLMELYPTRNVLRQLFKSAYLIRPAFRGDYVFVYPKEFMPLLNTVRSRHKTYILTNAHEAFPV